MLAHDPISVNVYHKMMHKKKYVKIFQESIYSAPLSFSRFIPFYIRTFFKLYWKRGTWVLFIVFPSFHKIRCLVRFLWNKSWTHSMWLILFLNIDFNFLRFYAHKMRLIFNNKKKHTRTNSINFIVSLKSRMYIARSQ